MDAGAKTKRTDDLSGLAAALLRSPQISHPNEGQAILALARMIRIVNRLRSHQTDVAGELGLNCGDVDVLFILQRSAATDPPRVADLAATLNVTTSGISKRVQRLEDMGYVRRQSDSEDRRSVRFQLTEPGLAATVTARSALRRDMMAALSRQEWEDLDAKLARLGATLGSAAEE